MAVLSEKVRVLLTGRAGRRCLGWLDLDQITVSQTIRRIDDDLITFGQTLHLQAVSQIAIDIDLANGNLAVRANHPDGDSMCWMSSTVVVRTRS
ncbi:MAG TPA: hypothetical protein VFS35_05205 [Terrimicrobiaceae bacterium]|nr:hypothetical protein [Terrimicrobiaceae bacterium]